MINQNVNASVDANVGASCYIYILGNHLGAPRQGYGPLLYHNLKSAKWNTSPKNSDMFTLKIQPAAGVGDGEMCGWEGGGYPVTLASGCIVRGSRGLNMYPPCLSIINTKDMKDRHSWV